MIRLQILILIFVYNITYSQWDKTSWKSDEVIINYCASQNIILYNNAYGGIVISTDYGNDWSAINTLPNDIIANAILLDNNYIFFGGFGFLYRSTDFGQNWTSLSNGMQNSPIINSIIKIGNKLFTGTSDGIYISIDNGDNWIIKNKGFGKYLTVFEMISYGENIFVSNQNGIYLSSDYGENWIQKNNSLPIGYTYDKFSIMDSLILIGSNVDTYNGGINKLYITSNLGNTWNEGNNQPFNKSYTYSFTCIGKRIILSSKDSLFISDDSARTWINLTKNLPEALQHGIDFFRVDGDIVYAISGSEIYLSTDKGITWIAIRKVRNFGIVYTLKTIGNRIFAGTNPIKKITTYLDGILSSTDFGSTWEPKGLLNKNVMVIYTNYNSVFAITNDGNYLSTDMGSTWLEPYKGFPDSSEVWSMDFYSKGIVAACGKDGIKGSIDSGKSWTNLNKGLPLPNQRITSLKIMDNTIFAGLDSSFYISTDLGLSWKEKSYSLPHTDLMIWQIETNGDSIYIVSKYGIYYSSDFGENWNLISNGLPNWDYNNNKDNYNCKIKILNGSILAEINSSSGGFFISSNNGNNWVSKNNGITNIDLALSSLVVVNDSIYIGTNSGRNGKKGDGIFKSRIYNLITDVNDNSNLEENKHDIIISPNPASDFIDISVGTCRDLSLHDVYGYIRIYNVMGECVLLTVRHDETNRIDVSAMPEGMYFIRVGDQVSKFIVVR